MTGERGAPTLTTVLVGVFVTLLLGLLLGRDGMGWQAAVCVTIGSAALAASNIFDALARSGKDPLPWGVVVVANVVFVVVALSLLVLRGVGAGVLSRSLWPRRPRATR
jgi:hypothetical protein